MKKILVPIDYSTHSDQAVQFALEIAKIIHADLHLFHAVEIPTLITTSELVVLPVGTTDELIEDASKVMRKYVKKIQGNQSINTQYLPNITYSTAIGNTIQAIEHTITVEKPTLMVMGMEGKGKLKRFFLGSTSKNIIENVKIPTLLIPPNTEYEAPKKIAFATDLSESDLNSIHYLARLFYLYDPEIVLVHVSNEPSGFQDPKSDANKFLNRVTCNINYGKIYYRHIIDSNLEKGLTWLSDKGQIQILSMIHRPKDLFSQMLAKSHTQNLAKTIHRPLLIMPEDKTPISW